MVKYKTLLFVCLLPFQGKGQVAIAGAGQTIYLTSTSTAILDGSASHGIKYHWEDVSTDYKSGKITNEYAKKTTVTGLSQGVFYYQLKVTTGRKSVYDTTVIKVDYAPPPGRKIIGFNMSDATILSHINARQDTTSFFPVTDYGYGQVTDANRDDWYLFRDRLPGLQIDNQKAKLTSTIQEGYKGIDGYPRAEIGLAIYSFRLDTTHTYCFGYKGYFPQKYNYLKSWYRILTMLQIHSSTQVATVWQIDLNAKGNLISIDTYNNGSGLVAPEKAIGTLSGFYNQAHTIRLIMREGTGYTGQTAFIKVQVDGTTVYYRNTGQVGSASFDDYVKFGGLYDWNNAMVNGRLSTHAHKFQLVTEDFNIYDVTGKLIHL